MPQSLAEREFVFIQNLKITTGKDIQEWLAILESCELTNRKQLKIWLQENHQLDYMVAHKLTFLYMEWRSLNEAKLSFTSMGRGGDIIYESKECTFTMWYEFGGAGALAIINIPGIEHWESITKTPLGQRLTILNFIGQKVVERQTGGKGTYRIEPDFIVLFP